MGAVVDRDAPFYFMKSACHHVPSGATVPYPPGTANYHFEMELVVAMGAAVFCADRDHALDAVYGYACGLDMTRRDLQSAARDKGRPWDTGKNFEQSAVVSPIAPSRVICHPARGAIELHVNGIRRQAGDIGSLIHSVSAIIANLSELYHLVPGDLIYTGTPEGVGPALPGDVLKGSIAGVGDISLNIAASP